MKLSFGSIKKKKKNPTCYIYSIFFVSAYLKEKLILLFFKYKKCYFVVEWCFCCFVLFFILSQL